MTYEIVIPGVPVGKARPKFRRAGDNVFSYTPKKTKVYENMAGTLCKEKIKEPLLGNVKMTVTAFYKIPLSASKKEKEKMRNGEKRPTVKPDIDNAVKCLMDSFNGIAYMDDKQVVELYCRKYYSDEPRVEVEIEDV